MGFFSDLENEGYDRVYSDKDLVKRMVSYFKPHSKRMYYVTFFLLLTAVSAAYVPIIVKDIIGELDSAISLNQALSLGGLVTAFGVLVWGANWVRRRMTGRVLADVVMEIRTSAFEAATNHDLSFYDEFSSGKIVSRITSDTREFGNVVALVADLISQLIQIGICLKTQTAELPAK